MNFPNEGGAEAQTSVFKKSWLRAPFLRSLAHLCVQLCLLSFLASSVLHFFPGSPFQDDAETPAFLRQALETEYGFEGHFWTRWWQFIHSGFGWQGPSLVQPGRRVGEVLQELAPYSLRLALGGFLLMLAGASLLLSVGVLCQKISPKASLFLERGLRWTSSIPLILLAPTWIFLLGWTSPTWIFFFLALRPSLLLALLWLQSFRNLQQAPWLLYQKHLGIRSSLGPTQSLLRLLGKDSLGQIFNFVLSFLNGSFFLEVLFNRPGWGRLLVVAFSERDYFFVSHFIFVSGALILLLRSAINGLNSLLDPRNPDPRSFPSRFWGRVP